MTRDIRFRGWDGEEKRMWSWRELLNTHPLGCLYSHGDGSWEVMQFTGLRDKNGVEIYEGDVVHHGDPNICYTVVFQDASFTCRQHGNRSTAGLAHWQERTEVIGNIYENPELIKTESE